MEFGLVLVDVSNIQRISEAVYYDLHTQHFLLGGLSLLAAFCTYDWPFSSVS
jgi:hypothetical protein